MSTLNEPTNPTQSKITLDVEGLRSVSEMFSALGVQNRLKIWLYLAFAPRAVSVSQICDILGMSTQLVSHHLKVLRNARLIDSRPKHPFELYYPSRESLGLLHKILDDARQTVLSRLIEDI